VTLVNEGESAIYEPDGAGSAALAALVMADQWVALSD
jgi:hypothetical protein